MTAKETEAEERATVVATVSTMLDTICAKISGSSAIDLPIPIAAVLPPPLTLAPSAVDGDIGGSTGDPDISPSSSSDSVGVGACLASQTPAAPAGAGSSSACSSKAKGDDNGSFDIGLVLGSFSAGGIQAELAPSGSGGDGGLGEGGLGVAVAAIEGGRGERAGNEGSGGCPLTLVSRCSDGLAGRSRDRSSVLTPMATATRGECSDDLTAEMRMGRRGMKDGEERFGRGNEEVLVEATAVSAAVDPAEPTLENIPKAHAGQSSRHQSASIASVTSPTSGATSGATIRETTNGATRETSTETNIVMTSEAPGGEASTESQSDALHAKCSLRSSSIPTALQQSRCVSPQPSSPKTNPDTHLESTVAPEQCAALAAADTEKCSTDCSETGRQVSRTRDQAIIAGGGTKRSLGQVTSALPKRPRRNDYSGHRGRFVGFHMVAGTAVGQGAGDRECCGSLSSPPASAAAGERFFLH